MTFDLISGLHMQSQTWHPPLWLCTHAKYYVKSGLTNVLKNANKTKNMHLFFDSDYILQTSSVVCLSLLNSGCHDESTHNVPSHLGSHCFGMVSYATISGPT